jgi:type IV pilus assembly protein PilA
MFAIQEEAKVNLEAIWTAEIAYFSNTNTYAPTFDQIGWEPDAGYRYAYFLPDQEIQPEGAEPYQLPAGLAPLITEVSFTAYAVSNIDCDAVMDVWMVHDARAIENLVNDVLE